VDWSVLAVDFPYFTARKRCKEIGNYVGEMITTMTENTPQSNDDVHIIGFSMGAHIAGYAGKRLEGKLHRITGNIKYVNAISASIRTRLTNNSNTRLLDAGLVLKRVRV